MSISIQSNAKLYSWMEDKLSTGGNNKRFRKGPKPEYGNSGPENFVHPAFKISGSALGSQGQLIVYQWPSSVRPSVLRPHFQTWISLKPVGQSWSNFMCSITGWRKVCIRFWGRLDQNSGFHGNRKPPLTYNGENDVSTFFSVVFGWILFILAGKEDMHKISDEFEFRPDRTTATDYGVSCPWMSKKFPIDL